jgi:transposase
MFQIRFTFASMQKKFIKLSQEEIITLQEGRKNHSSYQFRDRCHCLLLSNEGKGVKELAGILQVSSITIYNWFHRWEQKGIVGLINQKGQGRKAILLAADGEKVRQKVQAHAQQIKVAREELKKELSKEFSHKTLKRYLKKLVQGGNAGEKA